MAEASSASGPTTAARLREAAKLTMMRRQQAPLSKQSSTSTLRNDGAASVNASPGRLSAAGTSSAKVMPKGPRRADADTSKPVSLNYGDPGEASGSENPVPSVSGSAKPSAPMRKPPGRRVSITRARAEAIQSDETVEEGEISEGEESKPKLFSEESAPAPVVSASFQPVSAPIIIPSLNATNSAKDVDPALQPPATETESNRIQPAATQPPSAIPTPPKRSSISAGMQPPRPTANVHREPAPISPPTASFPSTHVPTTIRKPRTDQQSFDTYSNGTPSLPSLNTYSFDDLSKNSPIDTVMSDKGHDDDSTDELSPKTSQMNQEVFARLLQLGVDNEHCRPGLPMTFQQFNEAKQLILDLLGLGMTPENIADIPVNRRLLVYCLRELKIRLPDNIPVDDIVLFDPPLDSSRDHYPDEENLEQSSPVQHPHDQNDDVPSIDSVEDTTTDVLIVENVSESPSTSLPPLPLPSPPLPTADTIPAPPSPPLPTDTIAAPSSPTPVSTPLPPTQSKLNIHAEPFLPAKPPPPTTGPSLASMALPHQQIPPLPPREQFPLPPRPSFSLEAPSSRRSTAGSSSAATIVPAVATRTNTEAEVAPQQDAGILQRLEQEKKLLLLRAKLQSQRKGTTVPRRRDSAPTPESTEKPSLDTAVQSTSLILGGDHVGSPTQMEVDEQAPTSSNSTNMEVTVISPTPVVTMPQRPPIQLRATLARALASGDSTRPSTPSENGQKRGVKRPKADDFVEDNYPKKSARLNGNLNAPPLKRSSFAIANSAPPEQLIITWVDDENVEVPAITPLSSSREQSGTNAARDAEAAQVAAAAMAIGLPMTAEELEAARLQEEERKAQLNAKAAKLLNVRANLRRLELKKEEKKLSTLQSAKDPSAVAADILHARHKMDILKQELETINTELAELQPAGSEKTAVREALYIQSTTGVSTPELSVTLEQTAETSLASLPPPVIAASDSSSPNNEDWEMLKDDDLDVIIADDFSETAADRLMVDQQEEPDAVHDILHQEAASQSRLTPYSPPLILSVLTARRTPSNQLTYLNGDENLRATNPSQFDSAPAKIPFDPERTLCQFESVGGVCRDTDCKDLHFRDFPA